jgi:hypothetical protein
MRHKLRHPSEPGFTFVPWHQHFPEELTGIALDSLLVSNPSPFGVKSRRPPGLSLAEQIPALIQHDLDPLEPVAVSLIRVAVGLPLEEFVLLSRKLIDVVTDLFVVHGFSPKSVGAWAQSFYNNLAPKRNRRTQRSPFAVPPFTVHRSPFTVHRSPLNEAATRSP